ncbi:MAG: acyl-CoA dehydrogenase family protein [Sphingobium phenoxybenzoativorans]|uniref:Acyl-CoA dehydrogenase family protein n=1 Tax=Sphingobium phenoxybenzoativorans TaxID=1592790 RepID=A0A975K8E1_9SPHN|nr:acyl-CoA dehydrogenase family protein [Sphingobium phenoxybenzoativorans]QUT06706.1 acyl-CoA dehydrogenase family protein [Sphingobium phenoxybenzoativorans]
MNLDFTPEDDLFRQEVRAWLADNVPREVRPADGPDMKAFDLAWQKRQYDGGWAGIAWPQEYGGRGFSTIQQLIWYQEYARAGAPYVGVNFVGLLHGGPTLIANGSEEQKTSHLPRILKGEEVWCQGFSEPGSGSDLASLRTRGEIDGDHLVVNGQKIWTSFGQFADFQELLVRTDPDAPKHKGISWVICDMRSPGIRVRPIKTIAGHPEYCEVFYDDVRIPLANVVGGLNNGWRVAMSTLGFERGTGFMAEQVRLATDLEALIATVKARVDLARDTDIQRRLARLRAEVAALQAMTYSSISLNERRGAPGAEASILRLYHGLLTQRLGRMSMEILGAGSLELTDPEEGWTGPYLYSFSRTIGGGTAEIQRNIIAERVLGLPRSR